ncbi:3629_t:CDS:2 [Acaulospora morrowiae]|uniref:RBR-type E3 ubiquitin transferase n=1 Tax=Acaulospora morrowiae TaxID=94023 RepID=A0A9N8YNK4_9GLOM|nr:3629_t:CDS:2 [Acaulospora morrowiae]
MMLLKCCICYEGFSTIKKITSDCNHNVDICADCILGHIKEELESKGVDAPLRCPKPRCKAELTYNDVHRLASKELFTRYDRLLMISVIRKLPNFRWCKAPKCGSGQEHTTGDDSPIVTCKACGEKSCFTHDVPWHKDLTCGEFDEILSTRSNTATRAYYERHTKQCPKCASPIEKNEGCDHMTCYCGHEFCWL